MADPVDVLSGCPNRHCGMLLGYLKTDIVQLEDLDYEDVFYPLRHHHADGLALRVTDGRALQDYVWGGDDCIYFAEEERQVMANAINPFHLWSSLQMSGVSFDIVIHEP